MKHQHWSFKANTETFDGRRAVKEAWALPPYTVWLDAGADDVREMIAKLRKPQRVAVSGYGPAPADNPEPKDNPAAEPTPIAPFVWQGEGVYCRRNGMRSTLTRRRGYEGDYPLRDADGEDYDLSGCLYQGEHHDADFVGGKVADL